jgi:uncharacterized protein
MDLTDVTFSSIKDFCERWGVLEFSLFGSILRGEVRPESDVDVLVELPEDHDLSLYDLVDMADELKQVFGRDVDLVSKSGLRNPFRRHEILRTRKVIYATTGS